MENLEIVLTTLYGLCGAIAVFGYGPQLYRLYRDRTSSQNMAISTWLLWSVTSLIAVLYASFVNKDALLFTIMACNFIGTFSILMLVVRNRYALFAPANV